MTQDEKQTKEQQLLKQQRELKEQEQKTHKGEDPELDKVMDKGYVERITEKTEKH